MLGAPPILAQDSARSAQAQAVALAQQAKRHFDLTEYQEALALYRDAYRLSGDSLLLYNIAQSYRLLGEKREALTFYQKFLRTEPAPELRALAESFRDALVAELAQEEAASLPASLPLPAASQAAASQASTLPASLRTPSTPTEEAPRPRGPRWVMGAGTGVAALGLALGGAALAQQRASDTRFAEGDLDGTLLARERRDTLAASANVVLGAGGLVLLGGAAWSLLVRAQ